MPRQWIIICAQLAVLNSFLLAYVCAAANHFGTISVVGPAFVNREVTLKGTPFHPWGCHVEWMYIKDGDTIFQTMNGTNVKIYSEDRSFFLKWTPSIEYNGSNFYAGCSSNNTIKTSMTSLTMKKIVGQCGALVLLSPVVRGASVKLGYFPSDYFIRRQTNTTRTWKKNTQVIELQGGSYEEKIVSELLYILSIINFEERNEGTYTLNCYPTSKTDSVQLHIPETGSWPVLRVPEQIHGEMSISICEVRNAFPAPIIEIRVDKVVQADVHQMDLFSGSSHTFTSTATMTKTNKAWNGKQMCCTMKTKYEFGLGNVSVCKNINMKYPPLDLSMSVHNRHDYNKNGYNCFLNMSCETDASNPPCTIEWSSDNDNLRYVYMKNWTNGDSGRYRSISNVLFSVTTGMAGGTITCSTRCDHFPSGLYKDYSLYSSEFYMETDIIKESSHKILNLTCHSGGPCMPCKIVWSSNSVYLYPISTSQWTRNSGSGYISVSNALYLITKDVDGKRIQCSVNCGNESLYSNNRTYTISFKAVQESTTIYASVVSHQWHTPVLYALSGTFLLALVTKLTVLLLRRCKPHAYERFLRLRGPLASDPSRHVYDAVQYTVETTALHDIRRISESVPVNTLLYRLWKNTKSAQTETYATTTMWIPHPSNKTKEQIQRLELIYTRYKATYLTNQSV